MPGARHVFDPLCAAILSQRERESGFAGAAKLVDSRALAAFRGLSTRFLDCDRIPGHCDIAPNVAFRIDDIEGVVGFDRPDSTQRVCPRPDQGPTGGRISRACTQQREHNASENDSATIKNDAENVLRAIDGVRSAKVLIDIHAPPAGAGTGVGATRIPGIKHSIAVASGKGGVGKSTVAANLAVALEQTKARVGLCDCDIYGPSISLMFGTRDRPMATEENKNVPIEQYGWRWMSMGFLLDDTSPAILRVPMVTRYTQQFLRQVEWGELDYLVLDLPPGTGDIQLTIVQTVA